MAIPDYTTWISKTKRFGRSRGKLLQDLDLALKNYKSDKPTLNTLDDALTKWQNSKTDWEDSCRDHKGIVTQLMNGIADEKSRINGTGAYAGPSLAAQAVQKLNARQALIDADSTLVGANVSQALDYRDGSGLRQFAWTTKLKFTRRRMGLEVQVFMKPVVGGVAADGTFKSNWKTHCLAAWNNKAQFRDGTEKPFGVSFDLVFVDDSFTGNAYEVNVANPPPLPNGTTWRDKAAKRTEIKDGSSMGTPHMLQWGQADKEAIAHEFGHMIGLPDEYYTKQYNGVAVPADVYDQVPFTTNSIMNNTSSSGNRIFARHFYFVRDQYALWKGKAANTIEVIV